MPGKPMATSSGAAMAAECRSRKRPDEAAEQPADDQRPDTAVRADGGVAGAGLR